ncbi:uncharacterized protein [Miscanthus floridulus]|uniref:uncharacterized protein n=1 Tax=Miscanthus floridulus TaxID=154761 RepID=UPI00345B1691
MAEAGAPETAEAMIAEAEAPEVTMAVVMAARPSVQEAEMQASVASAVPLAPGPPLLRESARETEVYPISSDDTSWAREVADAEETDAVKQPAPLLGEGSSALVRIKELEEELTRAISNRDAFRSRAEEATASSKALAGQLGEEESAHLLTKGTLNEALASVEASQIEAMVLRGTVEELGSEVSRAAAETRRWEQKAKESEAEFARAAEASSAVQTVLDNKIEEHEALKHAALSACEALEVEGVQSGSSLGSRLIALSS